MSTPTPLPPTAQQVRTLQIVAASLVGGVTMFLLVAILLRGSTGPLFDPARPLTDPLTLVGLVVGLSALAAARVVPDLATTAAIGKIPTTDSPESRRGQLVQAFATRTIIGLALIEGAAFLNLIVYFINGTWPNLALAVVLLLALAAGIPTVDRLDSWLERQADSFRSAG
jgi:hypothetical protein